MSTGASNNATSSVRGIIYQFFVVLDVLPRLAEGQTVLIETDGDLSILRETLEGGTLNEEQREIKHYGDVLTDRLVKVLNARIRIEDHRSERELIG